MAKPKNKNEKPERQSVDVSVAADSDSDKDFDLADELEIKDFQELYGDGTKDIKVELYRDEPKFHGGKKADGFMRIMAPGDDIETIRQAHGGGDYRLTQRIRGKFAAQRFFRVYGDPNLESPPPDRAASAPADKPPDATSPPDAIAAVPDGGEAVRVNVGGVDIPLTADLAEIKKMMLYVRMLKTAFPDPPDINDTLLKLLIEGRRDPDVLDQVDKLTAVFDRLKSISPAEAGGSTNWLDIGSQVINAFVSYVEAASGKPRRAGLAAMPQIPKKPQIAPVAEPVPEPVRSRYGAGTEPVPEPVLSGTGTPLSNGREPEIMTYQLIAEKAAAYIVQGYISEPQQTPAETAAVLDAVVGLPESDRAELSAYKDVLRLVAKNNYAALVETTPEDTEKFILYFNKVFDMFVSTENLKPKRVDKNESPKN